MPTTRRRPRRPSGRTPRRCLGVPSRSRSALSGSPLQKRTCPPGPARQPIGGGRYASSSARRLPTTSGRTQRAPVVLPGAQRADIPPMPTVGPETNRGRNCRPRRRSSRIESRAAERSSARGGSAARTRRLWFQRHGEAWLLTGQCRPPDPQPRRRRRRARGPRRFRRPHRRPVRPSGSRSINEPSAEMDKEVRSDGPVGACRTFEDVYPWRRFVSVHRPMLTRARPARRWRPELAGSPGATYTLPIGGAAGAAGKHPAGLGGRQRTASREPGGCVPSRHPGSSARGPTISDRDLCGHRLPAAHYGRSVQHWSPPSPRSNPGDSYPRSTAPSPMPALSRGRSPPGLPAQVAPAS